MRDEEFLNAFERMIDEMAQEVGEQNEAAGETNLPHSDPTQEIAWTKGRSRHSQGRFPRSDMIACFQNRSQQAMFRFRPPEKQKRS